MRNNLIGALGAAALLVAFATPAFAASWADTGHAILIDVDSIRKGPDGLVYHLEKPKYDDNPTTLEAATDCVRRISYSGYSLKYESDWRSKGRSVIPGTMGAFLLDFVCTRVK